MKRAFVLHIAVRVTIEAVFFWILHSIAARNNGMDWEIPGVITANSTVSLSSKKSLSFDKSIPYIKLSAVQCMASSKTLRVSPQCSSVVCRASEAESLLSRRQSFMLGRQSKRENHYSQIYACDDRTDMKLQNQRIL